MGEGEDERLAEVERGEGEDDRALGELVRGDEGASEEREGKGLGKGEVD